MSWSEQKLGYYILKILGLKTLLRKDSNIVVDYYYFISFFLSSSIICDVEILINLAQFHYFSIALHIVIIIVVSLFSLYVHFIEDKDFANFVDSSCFSALP